MHVIEFEGRGIHKLLGVIKFINGGIRLKLYATLLTF